MSLPTFSEASDDIKALFDVAWSVNTPAVNGGAVPRVEWDSRDRDDVSTIIEPTARFFLRHHSGGQSTFGAVGARRFTRRGLITIQVFVPLTNRAGLSLAENLATIARNAYEGVGTANGIWFRNARIQEIGPNRGVYQMNVVVEFEYDELK